MELEPILLTEKDIRKILESDVQLIPDDFYEAVVKMAEHQLKMRKFFESLRGGD